MTNGDLISRNALLAKLPQVDIYDNSLIYKSSAIASVRDMIAEAPPIEAEPVRHGRWIIEKEPGAIRANGDPMYRAICASCNFTWGNTLVAGLYFAYCPN